MINKFTIVLGTTPVTFDLIESPVVETWRQILLDAKDYQCDLFFSAKYLPNKSLQELSDELTKTISKLNAVNFKLPPWSGVKNNNFDQEELNRLHEEFHRQEDELERVDKQLKSVSKETTELMQKLNIGIHKLEARVKNHFYSTCSVKYDHLRKMPAEKARVDINLEHRKCFTYTDVLYSNDSMYLMLGYHTIGKSLWDCFVDDDFDLIKKGLLSPQLKISSEFNIMFGSRTTKNGFLKIENDLKKWVAENDDEGLIDFDLPENKYFYYPTIAILSKETTLPTDDIMQLIEKNTVSDYYFS